MANRVAKFCAVVILLTSALLFEPQVLASDAGAANRNTTAKFCREAVASSVETRSVVAADRAVDEMRQAAKIAPKYLKREMLKLTDEIRNVLATGKVTKTEEASIEALASKVRPKIKSICGKS